MPTVVLVLIALLASTGLALADGASNDAGPEKPRKAARAKPLPTVSPQPSVRVTKERGVRVWRPVVAAAQSVYPGDDDGEGLAYAPPPPAYDHGGRGYGLPGGYWYGAPPHATPPGIGRFYGAPLRPHPGGVGHHGAPRRHGRHHVTVHVPRAPVVHNLTIRGAIPPGFFNQGGFRHPLTAHGAPLIPRSVGRNTAAMHASGHAAAPRAITGRRGGFRR